ncbi:MAG: DUF4407 domain-containing protein [Saprospiraceae bacterium]|nr:DUF4407 domain-containing protein [Saprospiraceae bacterium]
MPKLKDYKAPTPKSFEIFLWWCAGADKEILKECTYADYVKYSGLGGIVLATGILAWLSMSFALERVFDSYFIAAPGGISWGLIIFNLDRFVVSSTGKGDGKHTISWGEFVHAFPRLVMATMIGFTISAPLEIYIFQKEIDKQWEIRKDKEKANVRNEVKSHRKDEYDTYKLADERLLQESKTYNDQINNLTNMISDETTRLGCGPICKGHMRQREDLRNLVKENDKKLIPIKDSIRSIDVERELLVKEREQKFSGKLGMLDSLTALHEYPGSG